MEINKHTAFRKDKHPILVQYLKDNGIQFTDDEIISLDVYESDPHWTWILDYMQSHGIDVCLSETHFAKAERPNAQWLQMRCKWRNGYPQPEGDFAYETITYTRENYCAECGCGLAQVDVFRLKKEPKWGRRHFMLLNWVEDEFFVDDAAKNKLENSGFTGFRFQEVRNKNGTAVLPGVHQMVILSKTDKGIETDRPSIDNTDPCPRCGTFRYHPTGIGMVAFRKETLRNAPDIVKTAEVFGWGHYSAPLILVRQNLYRYLTEQHLDSGLVFEPIELVE